MPPVPLLEHSWRCCGLARSSTHFAAAPPLRARVFCYQADAVPRSEIEIVDCQQMGRGMPTTRSRAAPAAARRSQVAGLERLALEHPSGACGRVSVAVAIARRSRRRQGRCPPGRNRPPRSAWL
jgi:hypothetical protein